MCALYVLSVCTVRACVCKSYSAVHPYICACVCVCMSVHVCEVRVPMFASTSVCLYVCVTICV